jgi:hypothetical protein
LMSRPRNHRLAHLPMNFCQKDHRRIL